MLYVGRREPSHGAGPCAAYPDPVMPRQPRGAMSDDPIKPSRFPLVAALLCAACVGAAAWTWMRYSYCWEVKLDEFWHGERNDNQPDRPVTPDYHLLDRYIRTRIRVGESWSVGTRRGGRGSFYHVHYVLDGRGPAHLLYGGADDLAGSEITVEGRACQLPEDVRPGIPIETWPSIDTTASRFHGASIAGLVVGAMGVFVFTVALRHWLGERRRFREEARGITPALNRASPES